MLLILLILSILSLAFGIWIANTGRRWGDDGTAYSVCGAFGTTILLATILAIHFSAIGTVAKLKAWHGHSAEVAKTAITESANEAIVSGHMPKDASVEMIELAVALNAGKLVNLDNVQQSSRVTEMIAKYKEQVLWYNAMLEKYRMLESHVLVWPLIPEIPDSVKPMDY